MRKSSLAAALLVLAATGAQAQGLPWCYRDVDAAPYAKCIFSTAQQCFAAAPIMGGVCERNHRPVGRKALGNHVGAVAG